MVSQDEIIKLLLSKGKKEVSIDELMRWFGFSSSQEMRDANIYKRLIRLEGKGVIEIRREYRPYHLRVKL